MKIKLLFLITLIFFVSFLNGQNISINWLTFLGGDSNDIGEAVTIDEKGNVYILGKSGSTWGNPIHGHDNPHQYFISVSKQSPNGELIWNTFLGNGQAGVADILIDKLGNVYITGSSGGTWGSPIVPNSEIRGGYVAKLSSRGHLSWNTYKIIP